MLGSPEGITFLSRVTFPASHYSMRWIAYGAIPARRDKSYEHLKDLSLWHYEASFTTLSSFFLLSRAVDQDLCVLDYDTSW